MTWLVDLLKKWRRITPVYRCGRCGRALLDPDSVTRGYGPDCWRAKRSAEGPKVVIVPEGELWPISKPDPLPDPGFRMDPETGEIAKLEEKKEEGKNEQTD